MKQCIHINEYLDGALAKDMQPYFENHLENCPHCRAQADEWRYIKEALVEWGNKRELPAPGPAQASELLLGLRPTIRKNPWQRYAILGALPVAACVALALAILFLGNDNNPQTPDATVEQFSLSVLHSDLSKVQLGNGVTGEQLTVPEDGSLLVGVGPDRIGLRSRSQVEVLEANSKQTRIKLRRGQIAVQVDPNRKNRNFTVLAGNIKVKVHGTVFGVSMDSSSNVHVAVQRGVVTVAGPKQTSHLLRKGQLLVIDPEESFSLVQLDETTNRMIGDLLTVPSDEIMEFSEDDIANLEQNMEADTGRDKSLRRHQNSNSDPEKWRTWILEGKHALAERSIVNHLNLFPGDIASWSLLATCRRKTKQWRGALNAYQKIVEMGNAKAANLARFEMARILQDHLGNNAAAAEVLSEYLKTPRMLEAEAMVRLGRARHQQGRTREAKQLWNQVIMRFRGTSAAVQASRLLENSSAEAGSESPL